MTWNEFKNSLDLEAPPELNPYQTALWFDGKGNWEQAHNIVQEINDRQAAWIHAYLHRKEGDNWNANYWYRRAGKEMPDGTLEDEWEMIGRSLINLQFRI